jgi:hypothetical protein
MEERRGRAAKWKKNWSALDQWRLERRDDARQARDGA